MKSLIDAIAAVIFAVVCLALMAVLIGLLLGLGGWAADVVRGLMP